MTKLNILLLFKHCLRLKVVGENQRKENRAKEARASDVNAATQKMLAQQKRWVHVIAHRSNERTVGHSS